jgi:hypothetical protein
VSSQIVTAVTVVSIITSVDGSSRNAVPWLIAGRIVRS